MWNAFKDVTLKFLKKHEQKSAVCQFNVNPSEVWKNAAQ